MQQLVVNVVCMKWGTRYNAEDVNILHSMVKKNLTLPHRFVCLTDNKEGIVEDVECFDMPKIEVPKNKDVSPWRKLGMFSEQIADLSGKTLFLDLDIIIINNIDCFFQFSDKFAIIENWTQKGRNIGNSSVYCYKIGAYPEIIQHYRENIEQVTTQYSNEQIYLSNMIKDKVFWPDHWCRSFKRHCLPNYIVRYFKIPSIPKDVKIIAFHGKPSIREAIKGGFFGNIFKYVKSTPWIQKYWQ